VYAPVDDSAEWARARGADDRALGVLFDRHSPRVFRHALRLVAVPADADEAMMSAFFELWRKRETVRLVDGSVLPWLLATTTFLCRNQTRTRRRYARVLAGLPRDEAVDAAETAEEHLQRLELRRELAAALRRLSDIDAALIALTTVEGLTAAQAASALGLSPGAARMRLSRARGRLRELLADSPNAPQPLVPGGTP
jgi:RNA polymerase sigma factor (sigma-70 family)